MKDYNQYLDTSSSSSSSSWFESTLRMLDIMTHPILVLAFTIFIVIAIQCRESLLFWITSFSSTNHNNNVGIHNNVILSTPEYIWDRILYVLDIIWNMICFLPQQYFDYYYYYHENYDHHDEHTNHRQRQQQQQQQQQQSTTMMRLRMISSSSSTTQRRQGRRRRQGIPDLCYMTTEEGTAMTTEEAGTASMNVGRQQQQHNDNDHDNHDATGSSLSKEQFNSTNENDMDETWNNNKGSHDKNADDIMTPTTTTTNSMKTIHGRLHKKMVVIEPAFQDESQYPNGWLTYDPKKRMIVPWSSSSCSRTTTTALSTTSMTETNNNHNQQTKQNTKSNGHVNGHDTTTTTNKNVIDTCHETMRQQPAVDIMSVTTDTSTDTSAQSATTTTNSFPVPSQANSQTEISNSMEIQQHHEGGDQQQQQQQQMALMETLVK